MPVVEYMNHIYDGDHRRHIPGFIHDRGHWYNPSDETFVGWTRTKTNYYVPKTLKQLTKEDFVQRCLSMHNVEPIVVMQETEDRPGGVFVPLQTEEEVRAFAENWYDEFVTRNLQEEAES
jgi:hypothetical protein